MDVGEDTSIIVKRQASGAMCVSLFAIIISLVSIIFAIEAYALVKESSDVPHVQLYSPAPVVCPAGFATLEEMSSLVDEIETCQAAKK